MPASVAASSRPASSTPASVAASVVASSTPASVAASSAPASVAASSAPASSAVASSAVASSAVASSAVASSAVASSAVSIDMTSGWGDNGANTHVYSNGGVTYTFTTAGEVYATAPAGIPLIGQTLTFVMNVSTEYKASTADLKVFIQNTGSWTWMDKYINNADLVAGVDTSYIFPITSTIAALDGTNGFRVGLQPAAAAGGGTILIKSITVTPTPAP
jgi:endo-1,4-beta-xylanase